MAAAERGADQSQHGERLDRMLALLVEALEIMDREAERPDLGARLQGIIDDLEQMRQS
jgi:hypothetical protein